MTFEKDQIVYAYSGIRPLPASNASVPGLISRDHSSPVTEPGPSRPFPIISLIGGKWTTFRGFAEEVADTILTRLSRGRKATTRTMQIGGGKGFPATPQARENWLADAGAATGIEKHRLDQLLSRYGTKALAIARHQSRWAGEEHLADASGYSLSEIDYILRNEYVEHLSDIVMRRTTLAITGSLTERDLTQIARMAAEVLGWDEARIAAEIEAVMAQLRDRNQMRFPPAT
jgi:glycerol-3-phosphate dehydrogenase